MLGIVINVGCLVIDVVCYSVSKVQSFQVLYEAPYAILYHYGLELPENDGLYDSSDKRFSASLPMHSIPDKLNESGIEITNYQTTFGRCACGNGNDLECYQEILDNQLNLHNLSEEMRIDSSYT